MPPRPKDPLMTRPQWLLRRAAATAIMDELGLDDGYCSCAGTLQSIAIAASPWQMRLHYSAWVGAFGLLWALETGRVHGDDSGAIRHLEARALCELVADIAAACPSPRDVPNYIIARDLGRRDGK